MLKDCYDFSLYAAIWEDEERAEANREKYEVDSYPSDWRDILGDEEAGAAYWNLY